MHTLPKKGRYRLPCYLWPQEAQRLTSGPSGLTKPYGRGVIATWRLILLPRALRC